MNLQIKLGLLFGSLALLLIVSATLSYVLVRRIDNEGLCLFVGCRFYFDWEHRAFERGWPSFAHSFLNARLDRLP